MNGHHVIEAEFGVAGELRELVAQEREARERAEYTAQELARIVAQEMRRGDDERQLRTDAEEALAEMAARVAFEYSRAEEAEARVRDLGG